MSPLSPENSTTALSFNFTYDSKNLGESGSRRQLLLATSPSLPERPDQPECRYFMNTGTCKYGSDCKFHHPKERIAQSVTDPPGLPLRPVSFIIYLVHRNMHIVYVTVFFYIRLERLAWNIMNCSFKRFHAFVLLQILNCVQVTGLHDLFPVHLITNNSVINKSENSCCY